MQLFMDMDQMIGKDYERGLSLLKGICEKEAGIIAKYPVQTVEFKANKYAAIRKTLTMPEMSAFMSEVYGKIGEAMKKSRAKCLGPAVGIYYTWDEKTMSSDMAAGMPINKSITTNEILMIEIPADTAYLIDYYGSYSASVDAHTAMNLFFKMNNLKPKMPVIEEYITDPMTEPDSSKWLTKIYYFAE
jgi:effector-binding domain-containing protein